jgi:hypothetical protein
MKVESGAVKAACMPAKNKLKNKLDSPFRPVISNGAL